MKITFPFEEGKSSVVGKIGRPVAHVEFRSLQKGIWQPVTLIVDSGADYTLLPHFLMEPLDVHSGRDTFPMHTQGVGGRSKVFFLKKRVGIRIGSQISRIRAGFLSSDLIPPLLGRLDFLDHFRVTFDRDRTIIVSR